MIVETILTTMDRGGAINVAPMGVEWGDDTLVLRPFLETTTFHNLRDTGVAVVNLTDDVLIFARAAIGNPVVPTHAATRVQGVVLDAACSWREVEVTHVDDAPPRSRIDVRVLHHGIQREFIGFNRARNAVLEAAILATRTHLLPADDIRADYRRLQIIVDKTAGPREQEAMMLLTKFVGSRIDGERTR